MDDYIYREGKETSELLKKVHVGGETVYQEEYKVHTNRNELADDVSQLKGNVKDIDGKIPEEASDINQLSDKEYVNEKVSTDSATFRQTWNLVSDLSLTTAATHSDIEAALATAITTADNNDYCFVQIPTADATPTKIAHTERYKFNGTAWGYEFDIADPSSVPTTLAELQDDATHRLVTDTEKSEWSGKQDAIADTSKIGFGYVVCSTLGLAAEKVVTITDFVLKKNAIVSIHFTNGFTVENSTLNISETGAKDIWLNGSAIPMSKVRNNTILTVVYDGVRYNVISIEALEVPLTIGTVDLCLPSGLLWADRNVGANAPEGTGLFFSWGNVSGHAEGSGYDFTRAVWDTTPGATIEGDVVVGDDYDAARANMGAPWRMPTANEFMELVENCTREYTTLNNVNGYKFTSKKNGNSIFIPCAGYYDGTFLYGNIYGRYWSSTNYDENNANALRCDRDNFDVPKNYGKRFGFQVRAVL